MTLLFEIPGENLLGQNFPVYSHRSLSGKSYRAESRLVHMFDELGQDGVAFASRPVRPEIISKTAFLVVGAGSAECDITHQIDSSDKLSD